MQRILWRTAAAACLVLLSAASADAGCEAEQQDFTKRMSAFQQRMMTMDPCSSHRELGGLLNEFADLITRCMPGPTGTQAAAQYRQEATSALQSARDVCGR